jgi:uncharacterized membrane protein
MMADQLAVLVFHADTQGGIIDYSKDITKDFSTFKRSEKQATWAFNEIEKLVKDGKMSVESGTIVVKEEGGKVSLRKTSEWTAKSGARSGAFWGLLVGLIFAGPLLGLLGGLGLGALLGGKKQQPIDRAFMKQLGESMKQNEAALFLLIEEDDAATLQQLQSFDATLFTTVLTDDTKEAISHASKNDEVMAALEQDTGE